MLLQNRDLIAQLEIENPELVRNIDDPAKFEQVLSIYFFNILLSARLMKKAIQESYIFLLY